MHVRTPCVGTLGGLQTAPHVVAGPRREWRKPKPMMNGLKKSDGASLSEGGATTCEPEPGPKGRTRAGPGTTRNGARACHPTSWDSVAGVKGLSPATNNEQQCNPDPVPTRGLEPPADNPYRTQCPGASVPQHRRRPDLVGHASQHHVLEQPERTIQAFAATSRITRDQRSPFVGAGIRIASVFNSE